MTYDLIGLILIVFGLMVVIISALPFVMPGRYRIFAVILGVIILLGGFYMVTSQTSTSTLQTTPLPSPSPSPLPTTIAVSQLMFVYPTAGVTLNPNTLSATIPIEYNTTQISELGSNAIAYKAGAEVKQTFVVQRTDTLNNASIWKITVSTPSYFNSTTSKAYPYIIQNTTTTDAIGINGYWGSSTYLISLPAAGMSTVSVVFYLNYAGVSNLPLGQSFVITITLGSQTITDTFVVTGT
jgi:hypothetical protein